MAGSAPEIVVLVSIGCHPVSGRPRRADLDARALELALRAVPAERVTVLHAGDPTAAPLRDYLGMGPPRLACIELASGTDPFPALAAWLDAVHPRLILAGTAAEAGEGSGMAPYWLAHRLRLRLVPAIVGLALADGEAELVQAVRGGRRRRLISPLPLLATVGERSPTPRLPTFGRARRGVLDAVPGEGPPDDRSSWLARPARARPTRAMPTVPGRAADRLRIVQGVAAQAGSPANTATGPLVDLDPNAAAESVLRYLREEGLLAN